MTTLEKGDQLPDFTGKDENGNLISNATIKGKKTILFFYPKDNTPGCTTESCNLRDNYDLLREKGFQIIGISADDEKSHHKFIEKHSLPFPLIADTDKSVIKAFGIWGPKKFMGKEYDGIHRTTFVSDENNKLIAVFKKVKTKAHAEQILEEIE